MHEGVFYCCTVPEACTSWMMAIDDEIESVQYCGQYDIYIVYVAVGAKIVDTVHSTNFGKELCC